MKIRILGHDIKVSFSAKKAVEWENGGSFGAASFSYNEIVINDAVPAKSLRRASLLHEILEHINSKMLLGLDHDKQLNVLGEALYQVLRDNPKAVKYITGGKK